MQRKQHCFNCNSFLWTQHMMVAPNVASLHFKGVLRWCLWYRYTLFPVGDSGHTRWCRKTVFQQECAESVYCYHSPCVWAHTHTYFLSSSLSDHMPQSHSVFQGQVVRHHFVPCGEGLASKPGSPDRNHKALQRSSDAIRISALFCAAKCSCLVHTNNTLTEYILGLEHWCW